MERQKNVSWKRLSYTLTNIERSPKASLLLNCCKTTVKLSYPKLKVSKLSLQKISLKSYHKMVASYKLPNKRSLHQKLSWMIIHDTFLI